MESTTSLARMSYLPLTGVGFVEGLDPDEGVRHGLDPAGLRSGQDEDVV